MSAYWVVGIIGVALLLFALFFDDLLSSVFEGIESFELGDWFSLPVLAGFLAAFGIGGGLADLAGVPTLPTVAIGGTAGVALGWFALRLSRAASSMATDDTPRSTDLVGSSGRVVTPIAAGALGEVVVRLAGSPVKVTARAEGELPTGTDIVVVEVLSPTSVRVEAAETFWGPAESPEP